MQVLWSQGHIASAHAQDTQEDLEKKTSHRGFHVPDLATEDPLPRLSGFVQMKIAGQREAGLDKPRDWMYCHYP